MNNEEKEAIKLLDRLYKDLYLSDEVIHHGSGDKYDKFNNIYLYLNKLKEIHEKASKTDRHIEYLKKLYYDKYIIKREYIPESYYRHHQQIGLERGYGNIYISRDIKKQLQDEIIYNQKAKLDVWLHYFLSEDSNVYPFWAKYWAFQGMLKLGTFDKEKGTFNRRTKGTIEPFIDLNREALAISIDLIIKILNKEKINDNELENLVKTGSFQKIYTHTLTKILKDNKNIQKRNIGKWIKYNKGSDHMPLVQSLQGYHTGWCTAGESTAKSQLQNGDFYVYYTLNENGEFKIPRIAIRMEGNRIGEIRGIAKDQNLEPEMEKVVEEKIKDFPDKEEYNKKVRDMKQLTKIYKKHKNNQDLTPQELSFLYEIDNSIMGFGFVKDPRIQEIKKERGNIKKDLSYISNYKENQISIKQDEITKKTIYHYGYLDYQNINAENLILPKIVSGHVHFGKLKSAEGLVLPLIINGDLGLISLENSKGLVLPLVINGGLFLNALKSVKGLVFPNHIGTYLYLRSVTDVEELVLPESVGHSVDLQRLVSIKKLVLPKSVGTYVNLNSLKSVEGLVIPDPLTYNIYMCGFEITPENVYQYRHNKVKK